MHGKVLTSFELVYDLCRVNKLFAIIVTSVSTGTSTTLSMISENLLTVILKAHEPARFCKQKAFLTHHKKPNVGAASLEVD